MSAIAESKRNRLIIALLSCKTNAEAFQQVGISATQGYAWLADPSFQAEFRAAANDTLSSSLLRLRAGADKAVETLLRCMDEDSPKAVQARAALGYLQLCLQHGGVEDGEALDLGRLLTRAITNAPIEVVKYLSPVLKAAYGKE